ncbi:MAG: type 4b pilus protein PilO2 [Alphaproteobacteria bacterium]|nr:type 4b pilus protein PilO2 [Alphaproteobacteria bacterium]
MSGNYVQINKRKYAVGLLWQPLVSGFSSRAYAAKLARSIDRKRKLYVYYRSLIGLGARRLGHKSGMPSLAAEIMEALSEYSSVLAVFSVGKKYVLVAIRNGIILNDILFDDVILARKKYVELAEIPDWGALFAPGDWGMPRAVDRDLSELISGDVRAILRPISRFGARFFSFLLLAAFVLGGMYLFQEPINQMMMSKPQIAKIDPQLAAEYQRQIEEKNKELDIQYDVHPEPQPLVMPYELLPDVGKRAELCYRAIGFLMQPVTGWNQVSADCGETHASARFRRDFGTLDGFYAVAEKLMPGVFVQEISDDEITVRARLPELEPVPSQDSRDTDTLTRELVSRFQGIDTSANIMPVVDTVANETESAELYIIEISTESKLVPSEFMHVFDGMGGVYMTKVVWNAIKRTWNYEVIIYAK